MNKRIKKKLKKRGYIFHYKTYKNAIRNAQLLISQRSLTTQQPCIGYTEFNENTNKHWYWLHDTACGAKFPLTGGHYYNGSYGMVYRGTLPGLNNMY